MRGVDFAGDTISIVHRDRKVKIKLNLIRKLIKRAHLRSKIINREAPCSAKNNVLKICSFQKRAPKAKGRCPDTLDTPLDPPLGSKCAYVILH